MSAETPGGGAGPDLTPARQRALGVSLFNRAWELMDLDTRTADQDDELLAAAYASMYHWMQVGAPENLARSHWQVSRVCTVLGRAEAAGQHADRCLAVCLQHGIGDWDLAYAYEAQARAAAGAGDPEAARGHLERARAAAAQIEDPEDREHVEEDLATIPL